MAYWLLKSEPDDWSWAEQLAKGRDGAEWTGIRNFSAQRHLRAMKKGELVLLPYGQGARDRRHRQGDRGSAPGLDRLRLARHRRRRGRTAPTPVSLDRVKADKRLASMALVRLPRLSVRPVTDAEWRLVCHMGGRG